MDAVRKLVSGRLPAQAAGPHPDADVLAAFTENALPEAERKQVLAHIADCRDCRDILFLALPETVETQKILRVQPSRWSIALRWGTVAACVIVIAGVFTARHELFRERTQSASVAKPDAPSGYVSNSYDDAAKTKVAEKKVPADVENLRQAQALKEPAPAPLARGQAEPKHMTAKLQGNLNFDRSDEVRLTEPASPSLTVDSPAIKDLPLQNRSVTDLQQVAAGSPAPAPAPINGAHQNEVGYAQTGAVLRGLAKQEAAKNNLVGTILDAAGAVVPNAKVTTLGAIGSQTVTSDAQGKFAFGLAPGIYSVKAEATGFTAAELKRVQVAANQPASLELKLYPGSAAETVEVSAQGVALDAVDAKSQGLRSQPAVRREESRTRAQKTKAAAGTGAGLSFPVLQWTLSPAGAVQSSADGGSTWQTVEIAPNANFRALSAVGTSIWVGGSAGTLYRSNDSGQHWTRIVPTVQSGSLQADITRIDFVDLLNGVLFTGNGENWSTQDGGASWQRQ